MRNQKRWFVAAALVVLPCCGLLSDHESTSTAPNPPITTPTRGAAWLWGMVIEASGLCIEGAMVEVVRGQAQGQRIMQETPCDAWGYGGGFEFKDLSPGVEMTLRASAPGWSTEEGTFVPPSQTAVLIELKKL